MHKRIAGLLALLLMGVFSASAVAQSPAARVPALVVLSPTLEGTETPYRLTRFAGQAPRDVILLAPSATAADFSAAVEELIVIRRNVGDVPSSEGSVRVRRASGRAPARVLPWAGRVLSDLAAAPMRQVPGVGRVRAVQIWLPAQRSGGA